VRPRPSRGEVTRILRGISRGEREVDELLPLVYDELRSRAERYLRGERRDHTLQPTALVHEAYLRLVGGEAESWNDRRHFYAVAATAMRHVLIDHARKHGAHKRGGDIVAVSLADADRPTPAPQLDLLALDEALTRLAAFDSRKSRIVELRFFGGLTHEEIARVLQVTPRTVERHWSLARAWLYQTLRSEE